MSKCSHLCFFSFLKASQHAAYIFQEGCAELAEQAAGLGEDVTKVEASTVDGVSLQVWLPVCFHFHVQSIYLSKHADPCPACSSMLAQQELLGHCLDQLKQNQRKIEALESHLREAGPYEPFNAPEAPADVKARPQINYWTYHSRTTVAAHQRVQLSISSSSFCCSLARRPCRMSKRPYSTEIQLLTDYRGKSLIHHQVRQNI